MSTEGGEKQIRSPEPAEDWLSEDTELYCNLLPKETSILAFGTNKGEADVTVELCGVA